MRTDATTLPTPYLRLLLAALLFLCACVPQPTRDYAAEAQNALSRPRAWEQAQAQNAQADDAQSATILGDLVRSAPLAGLVDQALAANPGLDQTLTTLRIREVEYRKAGGALLPTAEAGFAARRQDGDTRTTYTGSLSVGWEVDLWSKLSDTAAAARKDMDEQHLLYQAARDTLAAEVMQSWLTCIATKRDIEIEERRLAVLQKNETFIVQRFKNGLGTMEDLDGARSSTASARATLEAYRESLAQEQRSLRTLLGSEEPLALQVLEDYPTVLAPLAGLPEQSLGRRPDLQAAYAAIQAGQYRASAAYKELLPSINLSLALEDVATSPTHALLTDPVWTLLGQLTAPLFQGGTLRAEAEIMDLETAQTFQAYRETLLAATQEVEDALGQERSLAKQQTHIEDALASSRNNLAQYQKKYRAGLVELLDLLTVQEQTYDLELTWNSLMHDRLANRIDLGLALGLGAAS